MFTRVLSVKKRFIKNKWNLLWLFFIYISLPTSSQACQVMPFKRANLVAPVEIKPEIPGYSLQMGNRSALERAYQTFLRTGKAPNIITEGFIEFAYGAQQPIVPASPFELSVISLELGEQVTNVSSGDPMRWSYSLAYSGSKIRQAHVMVKPSMSDISTDLVITTDKRFYTLKLVSKQSPHYYRDVRFWYPSDIQKNVEKEIARREESNNLNQGSSFNETDNNLDTTNLNFNYRIKSSFFKEKPKWYPTRVFDDTRQTYIQFPIIANRGDLPALFVKNRHQMTIANYRLKSSYFVVDQVFKEALLICGVGRNQETVAIINEQDAINHD